VEREAGRQREERKEDNKGVIERWGGGEREKERQGDGESKERIARERESRRERGRERSCLVYYNFVRKLASHIRGTHTDRVSTSITEDTHVMVCNITLVLSVTCT
jgi:hypothetical protein